MKLKAGDLLLAYCPFSNEVEAVFIALGVQQHVSVDEKQQSQHSLVYVIRACSSTKRTMRWAIYNDTRKLDITFIAHYND